MEAESQIAKLIKITNNKAKYDAQVKKLLANKAILAWILKTCTEEFAQFDPSEIVGFVEGDPEISTKAVHATDLDIGDEMVDGDQSIEGINTEDNGLKEQTIFYDIRLNACVPGQEQPIQLIINIEAQLDTAPGYPIEKKGNLLWKSVNLRSIWNGIPSFRIWKDTQGLYNLVLPESGQKATEYNQENCFYGIVSIRKY